MTTRSTRKLSRLRPPADMALEHWQRELRRQFGREQRFSVRNTGAAPVFSDFAVNNPRSGGTYRVTIRGAQPGENSCSCADFATNTLGTCKHIEFVLGRLERKRQTRTVLERGFHPTYSEIVLQYGAMREVRFRPGTKCPRALVELAATYFDRDGMLRHDAFAGFDGLLVAAARFRHDLRCDDGVLAFVAEVRDRQRREERVVDAFPRGVRDRAFRELIRADLYPYQREGALFAARAGRCLIGDEMGLGKTVQALAAVEIMARLFGVERVLIVCPTSLKHQWEREIARFTSRRAVVVGGMRARRQAQYTGAERFFTVTNYDTVHADLDVIGTWAPDVVILDEAQRIKNWNTRTARSVKRIASPYALVLTGTPLENRLEELVSIVEFVDKHRLGPTFRFLADHQVRDEHGKVVGYRHLERIGKSLAPLLIRRTKEQVLKELPERLDKTFFVPMTAEQRVQLLVRRLKKKPYEHVLFHGDLSGRQRRAALDRFRDEERCRVFLSTDAGGVGLNLQQASVVVNMDLPWNPAVLEQRIGRVHRLGQHRPVRVVNFVAQDSIEEGMLSVLQFKKALFAGVLDDGAREVFLGGSRLTRFMETVEKTTGAFGRTLIEEREPTEGGVERDGERERARNGRIPRGRREGREGRPQGATPLPAAAPASDPWQALLQAGLTVLEQMARASGAAAGFTSGTLPDPSQDRGDGRDGRDGRGRDGRARREGGKEGDGGHGRGGRDARGRPDGFRARDGRDVRDGLRVVERDPRTGQGYLKVPLPSPEVLDRALHAMGSLLQHFKR